MPSARASPVRPEARRSTSEGRLVRPGTLRTFSATQLRAEASTASLFFMGQILFRKIQYPGGTTRSYAGAIRLNLFNPHGNRQARAAGAQEGAADRHGLAQVARHRHRD